MSHQLFVKSLREPISISKEEAQGIQELMINQSKDGRTPVVIENVWTGTKGEIKFVKFPPRDNNEQENKNRKIEPMTESQALAFERCVNLSKSECEIGGFPTYNWPLFYMQSQGVIRLEFKELGEKRYGKDSVRFTQTVLQPDRYPEVQSELESYAKYIANIAYAIKQRERELEATAQEQKR